MPGAWENDYRRWPQTTQEHINPALLELLPSLARLTPPAIIIDKTSGGHLATVALNLSACS